MEKTNDWDEELGKTPENKRRTNRNIELYLNRDDLELMKKVVNDIIFSNLNLI